MFTRPTKSLGKLLLLTGTAAASAGGLAGIQYERHKQDDREQQQPPAIFSRVLAATPMSGSSELSPVVTQPEVAVPPKPTGLPAEPPAGISRIGEIMRFGFPGLDNIRSHRYVLRTTCETEQSKLITWYDGITTVCYCPCSEISW